MITIIVAGAEVSVNEGGGEGPPLVVSQLKGPNGSRWIMMDDSIVSSILLNNNNAGSAA